MIKKISVSVLTLVLFFCCCHQAVYSQNVEKHQTENGIQYGLWNVKVDKPAPALIILSSTIDESLGNRYFRQCGNQLASHGYLAISVDLPSHGTFHKKGESSGLMGWRRSCERNINFVDEVTLRISKVLDHLIAKNIVDPQQIAVCGTSRGGFIALHLAASDSRIKCVVAYAPVIELIALREFKGMADNSMMKQLSLIHLADQFKAKKIWLSIGDRDERVGTDHSIQFIRSVTKSSLAEGKTSFAELHVLPEPKGHTTPKGAAEDSAKWILNVFKK